jgi:hypothetical protein
MDSRSPAKNETLFHQGIPLVPSRAKQQQASSGRLGATSAGAIENDRRLHSMTIPSKLRGRGLALRSYTGTTKLQDKMSCLSRAYYQPHHITDRHVNKQDRIHNSCPSPFVVLLHLLTTIHSLHTILPRCLRLRHVRHSSDSHPKSAFLAATCLP